MNREELLRSARNLYENPGTNEALKVVLEETYPELKESEDERIRKAIGAAICGTTAETVLEANGAKLVDALAYLEKQKEQKTAKKDEIGYDLGREQGMDAGIEYVLNHLELYGLCKPAEWSEEDEKMFNRIIDTVQDSVAECDCYDTGCKARFALEEEANWLRNRLKSLRPQPHWKPSGEQIEALENSTALNEEQGAHLYSLLCDLKKQM